MSDLNDVIDVDIDSMTLGEMEIVEEMTGLGLDEIGAAMTRPGPKVKLLVALAYVVKRRTDPDITLDQVKAMQIKLAVDNPKGEPASNGLHDSASLPTSPYAASGVSFS